MKKIFLTLALVLVPAFSFSENQLAGSFRAKEYKMICAWDPEKLNKQVTELLSQDWVLWGLPFNTQNYGKFGCACQALVKYGK